MRTCFRYTTRTGGSNYQIVSVHSFESCSSEPPRIRLEVDAAGRAVENEVCLVLENALAVVELIRETLVVLAINAIGGLCRNPNFSSCIRTNA